MVTISAATLDDIPGIVDLGKAIQAQGAHSGTPMIEEQFAEYLMECIASAGLYVFVGKRDDRIVALLILNEFACPWNRNFVWASDLMFIATEGGPKMVRVAKKMRDCRGWHKLLLSTTTANKRVEKFYSHYGPRIGGVYEVE